LIVVRPTTKTKEVTLILHSNNPIINHKTGLLNRKGLRHLRRQHTCKNIRNYMNKWCCF